MTESVFSAVSVGEDVACGLVDGGRIGAGAKKTTVRPWCRQRFAECSACTGTVAWWCITAPAGLMQGLVLSFTVALRDPT